MSCYDCEHHRYQEWLREQDEQFNYDPEHPPLNYHSESGRINVVARTPVATQPDTRRMWAECPELMAALTTGRLERSGEQE